MPYGNRSHRAAQACGTVDILRGTSVEERLPAAVDGGSLNGCRHVAVGVEGIPHCACLRIEGSLRHPVQQRRNRRTQPRDLVEAGENIVGANGRRTVP